MHVVHGIVRSPLALLTVLLACGPETHDKDAWMVGTFSSRDLGHRSVGVEPVTHYEFRDDGSLVVTAVLTCPSSEETPVDEFEWTSSEDDLIKVELPEDEPLDGWRFAPGSECGLELDRVQDDRVVGTEQLTRGAVCLRDLPPCPEGSECDACETVWCDDAPPSCGDG